MFAVDGIKIDLSNNMIKAYTILYGMELGRWHTTEQYPYVIIVKKTIYLAGPRHLDMITLYIPKDKEDLSKDAKTLARLLKKEWVLYKRGHTNHLPLGTTP